MAHRSKRTRVRICVIRNDIQHIFWFGISEVNECIFECLYQDNPRDLQMIYDRFGSSQFFLKPLKCCFLINILLWFSFRCSLSNVLLFMNPSDKILKLYWCVAWAFVWGSFIFLLNLLRSWRAYYRIQIFMEIIDRTVVWLRLSLYVWITDTAPSSQSFVLGAQARIQNDMNMQMKTFDFIFSTQHSSA